MRRRQLGAQHALAGQVEVARVLEDGAGDDLAHLLALQPEAGDQPVERRGEHVLVGRLRVRRVGPGERDAVAADDRGLPGRGLRVARHGDLRGRVGLAGTESIRYCRHMKAEAVRRSSQDGPGRARRHREPRSPRPERNAAQRGATATRDSRWDEHRRARREQLVDATLAAVGKHGAGVGMEEIAAEAGTSKTVVYRHFADRAELYVAVCNRVADAAAAQAAGGDGEQRRTRAQMVAAAIDTYLAFLEADPELYRFVVHQQPPAGRRRRPDQQPVRPRRRRRPRPLIGARPRSRPAAIRPPPTPWGHGVVGTGPLGRRLVARAPIAPCSAANSPHT